MTYILNSVFPVILVAFLLVLVQSNSDDYSKALLDKCLTENDITREEFAEFVNSTSSEEEDEEEDDEEDNVERKFKCYIHCLARGVDLIDSNGYVDVEFLEKNGKHSEENWLAFTECKEEYDHLDDVCEYSYKFMFCLQEKLDMSKFFEESD